MGLVDGDILGRVGEGIRCRIGENHLVRIGCKLKLGTHFTAIDFVDPIKQCCNGRECSDLGATVILGIFPGCRDSDGVALAQIAIDQHGPLAIDPQRIQHLIHILSPPGILLLINGIGETVLKRIDVKGTPPVSKQTVKTMHGDIESTGIRGLIDGLAIVGFDRRVTLGQRVRKQGIGMNIKLHRSAIWEWQGQHTGKMPGFKRLVRNDHSDLVSSHIIGAPPCHALIHEGPLGFCRNLNRQTGDNHRNAMLHRASLPYLGDPKYGAA
ncbi:hypothetical protein D3C76_987280 [compost metagenome]